MEILVLFDSKTGNTYQLAQAVAEGITRVDGVRVRMRCPKETTPIEIIRKKKPWSDFYDFKMKEIQEVTLGDLRETDGLALGSPTRFGNVTPSMGNFIESTGPFWVSGELSGKPAGVFTSSSTMHGGQETTIISTWFPLAHLGYIIVPAGYTLPEINDTERGGTPYGPSSVTGLPDYQGATEVELNICRFFGERLANITKKLQSDKK